MMSRLGISTKIMALLIALGLLTVGVAINGSRTLLYADTRYSLLVDHKLPVTVLMARANRRIVAIPYAGYRAYAYDGASAEARAASSKAKADYEGAKALFDQAKERDPSVAGMLAPFETRLDKIYEAAAQAIKLGQANRNDEAKAILVGVDKEVAAISEDLIKINDVRIKDGENESNLLSADAASTSTLMLTVAGLGTLIAVVISFLFSRATIVRPLNALRTAMDTLAGGKNDLTIPGIDRGDEVGAMAKTVEVFRDAAIALEKSEALKAQADAEQKLVVESLEGGLGKLAQGDLTAEIRADFAPEYLTVKTNFNAALSSLRELIGSVMESTSTIRTGSGEIAQASEDLARRTEGNAASLEETSAAITQMDGRLKATAAAASRTVERADGAITTVSGGRAVADEAVQAMGRVSESAKGIDSVIEGLDKIAFQTRVLAMNAAVEAGRAGDAGRGFAVVADLVSALAMRAEEESKRARDQLTVTQTDIVAAVGAVEKVDAALVNISGDVGEVHKLLGEMAADNQAQSVAVTQISSAIGTMDQATQQNAAMVEETSAAARNLTSEVSALTEQAARFNVGAAQSRAVTPAYRAPAARKSASATKAVPVAAMANGAGAGDDWASF